MNALSTCPLVPVSWGEVIDKLTILEIKRDRISDPLKQANVARELRALTRVVSAVERSPRLAQLRFRLKAVNLDLWEIEDAIRKEEASGSFGPEFIALARAVYRTNDHRADLKRQINALLGSALMEEKSYAAWTGSASRSASSSPARTSAL